MKYKEKNKAEIKRNPNVAWQTMEDESLLISSATSMAHELNGTATWIWQNIEPPCSFDHLVKKMCQEFDLSSNQAIKDLEEFLSNLQQQELIV